MKNRLIPLLLGLAMLAALLCGCALKQPAAEEKTETVAAPTAAECADGYYRVVGRFHPGTAGSSLGRALSACEAYRFAAENKLTDTDPARLRDVLREARESLSEEELQYFDENIESVRELIGACRDDWEANRALFEDAGAAEEMEKLLGDPAAKDSWETLCAATEEN